MFSKPTSLAKKQEFFKIIYKQLEDHILLMVIHHLYFNKSTVD